MGPSAADEQSQDFLVELAFAREAAVASAQDFLLEALELRRDETLRGFDRLAPDVVLGHPLGIATTDLNEESGDAIEAELQARDAGPLPFALLELEQEFIGVVAMRRSSSSSAS